MDRCDIVKHHDDGDLTIQCDHTLYVMTSEGQVFQQVGDGAFGAVVSDMMLRDVVVGEVLGAGAIPLHGREDRKAPCRGCRIDPSKPMEAGNVMATTEDAIGTLSQDEVRDWCSELVELPDGRCERARGIREAARACKEQHPKDTRAFFECYAPRFSELTRG